MRMISPTFSLPQTQNNLQFIPYNGPPKPKQTSRRNPSEKVPSNNEYPNLDEIQCIGPASTSHGVEVIDLTCKYDIGGNRGGGSGDIGCDSILFPQNGHQSGEFEQLISMRTSRGATSDESLGQPAPSVGSSQENAVVIEDSQLESDTDEGCPREDDIGTQIDNQLEVSSISISECRGRECPTGTEDAINSEVVGAGTQASGLPRRELTSMRPTGSPMMNIEQPTQEVSSHTVPKATIHQLQSPMKAKRHGEFPTPENASSSGGNDGDGDDSDSDSDNHKTYDTLPTRKRKRPPPAHSIGRKRHSRKSNRASKQHPERPAHSAGRQKPSLFRGRPKNNEHASALCSQSETAPPTEADEDDEYEVEEILEARVCRGKLQYRVKWLGYEDDPAWYYASNFKNSPLKLLGFHKANPTRPGPRRLDWWVQCWKENRDADGHPDDDKPERSHTGGRTP